MACRRLPLFLIIGCLLAACSTVPTQLPPTPPADIEQQQSRWLEHSEQVGALTHWQLFGKVGLRTADLARSANITWRQEGEHFNINLSGPLGAGATELTGTSASVQVRIAGRGEFHTDNPEQLLREQTGWDLPVTTLLHWIKGVPSPQQDATFDLDEWGRLRHLQQAQWELKYPSYQQQETLWLPQKITLYHDEIILTLVIKGWSYPSPGAG